MFVFSSDCIRPRKCNMYCTHTYASLQLALTTYHSWASASSLMPPVSDISVCYRSIPIPEWVPLFRYRTGFGIGILFHSVTGLTGCRTVRHSGIFKNCTKEERCTPCTSLHGCRCILNLLYDVNKPYVQ
jgi:hypothetical protein